MRFEWGSFHVHGLAWLPNAPKFKNLSSSSDLVESTKEKITEYANRTISTIILFSFLMAIMSVMLHQQRLIHKSAISLVFK
uniref:Uncharacterized protein n=1 Tax=Amphimedon queenslandica TaxID=400682 RepID=A0A1X7VTB9_AMPQE